MIINVRTLLDYILYISQLSQYTQQLEHLVAPAAGVSSLWRASLDACHDLVQVHCVVAQTGDVIAILLIAIPAMLGAFAIVNLKSEWILPFTIGSCKCVQPLRTHRGAGSIMQVR